jgi:hypothetical protein
MEREPVCVNAHDRCYEGGPCPYCEVPARTPAPEGEVVAWRVKDYGGGWFLFYSEAAAQSSSRARNGALVQPLYASPVVPVGVSREEIARIVARDLARQDLVDWQPVAGWDLTWGYVDQQYVDFGEIADAILAALGTKGDNHD